MVTLICHQQKLNGNKEIKRTDSSNNEKMMLKNIKIKYLQCSCLQFCRQWPVYRTWANLAIVEYGRVDTPVENM